MSEDLLFRFSPKSNPADLLFGEAETVADTEVTVIGTLPGLSGAVQIGRIYQLEVEGAFPGLDGVTTLRYVSETDRPLVAQTEIRHQVAAPLEVGVRASHVQALRQEVGAQARWETAELRRAGAEVRSEQALPFRSGHASRFTQADPRRTMTAAKHADMLRDRRLSRTLRHQDGDPLRAGRLAYWQDRYRDRRPFVRSRWGPADPRRRAQGDRFSDGIDVRLGWTSLWETAMRPPPGRRPPYVPPPPDPCYLPVLPAHLKFTGVYTPDGALVFFCERHSGTQPPPPPPGGTIVVPIRSVYIMLNTVLLKRVVGNVNLPVLSFSLSIDADSWTWSFNATLPRAAMPDVEPVDGEPVELEAMINGVPYRLLAERLSTDRTFGRSDLKVTGRGRNAVLADPYATHKGFSAAGALTAQQLMEDALTDNGIPIGWAVDFDLEDWDVPGGTWAHQGTYISALQAIAGAAGGYLQPHRTDQTIRVLPRYPVAPWEWGSVTPDFELPAAAVVREGIEWVNKPLYNRVFVSGSRNGLLGQVTRAGTAGDVIAPAIVDDLLTGIPALRQRGLSILGDVGNQAEVTLRLPVLSETGVITPGSFVRYVDGPTTRIGLVRTTSVDGPVQLRQTLGLETHVSP